MEESDSQKKKDLWLIRLKLFYISFSFFKYSFWKVVTDSALLSPAENVALVQCVERETLTLAKSNGFRCIFTSNSSPLTQVQARTKNFLSIRISNSFLLPHSKYATTCSTTKSLANTKWTNSWQLMVRSLLLTLPTRSWSPLESSTFDTPSPCWPSRVSRIYDATFFDWTKIGHSPRQPPTRSWI